MNAEGASGGKGKADGGRRLRARILLIAFLLGSAVALFFGSPLSRVRHIQVVGTHSLTPAEVERAAGVPLGTWWFEVKPADVAGRIQRAFPLVADVRVHMSWTGSLQISVREKGVVAVFPSGGAWYRLLEDGTALDVVRPGEKIAMPLITLGAAPQVTLGKPVAPVADACRQLALLPPELRAQLAEVHLDDSAMWTVYTVDHYKLHVPAREFAQRMKWFPQIREQVKDRGPGEIWLTDPFRYAPFPGGRGGG